MEKIKIVILGTRGIPNNYGGFEQIAENLSLYLVKKGHDVTVYNPDTHPYKGEYWNGVKIQRMFCKEDKFGIAGNFIYDYLSLKDAVKKNVLISYWKWGIYPPYFTIVLRIKVKRKLSQIWMAWNGKDPNGILF